MRITFRLILSLVVAASAVVFMSAGYQARQARLRPEVSRAQAEAQVG